MLVVRIIHTPYSHRAQRARPATDLGQPLAATAKYSDPVILWASWQDKVQLMILILSQVSLPQLQKLYLRRITIRQPTNNIKSRTFPLPLPKRTSLRHVPRHVPQHTCSHGDIRHFTFTKLLLPSSPYADLAQGFAEDNA